MKRSDYIWGGLVIGGLALAQVFRKRERTREIKKIKKINSTDSMVKAYTSQKDLSLANLVMANLAGTSAMTAYSYWKSYREEEQFEEPEMLGKMLHRLLPQTIAIGPSQVAGWVAHYTVGFLFNITYGLLWKKSNLKPDIASGMLLGIPSGMIGMGMWTLMLKLHPDPPHTNLKEHLKQLFTAHLIFGMCSAVAYQQLQNLNPSTNVMN